MIKSGHPSEKMPIYVQAAISSLQTHPGFVGICLEVLAPETFLGVSIEPLKDYIKQRKPTDYANHVLGYHAQRLNSGYGSLEPHREEMHWILNSFSTPEAAKILLGSLKPETLQRETELRDVFRQRVPQDYANHVKDYHAQRLNSGYGNLEPHREEIGWILDRFPTRQTEGIIRRALTEQTLRQAPEIAEKLDSIARGGLTSRRGAEATAYRNG